MRVFIGIEFNDQVKDYLADVQNVVRNNVVQGSYTRYHNFHLTLRFLGELTQNEVNTYCLILEKLKDKSKSCQIEIGNIHSFKRHNKHLVFVDVIKNQYQLISLSNALDDIIKEVLNQKRDGKFKPHITIAREVMYDDEISSIKIPFFKEEVTVKKISLMLSSRDQNNTLTYTPIYSVHLNQ